jgi:uncharacterized protein
MSSILFAVITGLSIGALGSFHCIGMCGPIALTLPVHGQTGWYKTGSILLYNTGRAVSYAMMGFVFGFLGSGFGIFGLQQFLSVFAGSIILLLLIFNRLSPVQNALFSKVNQSVKVKLGKYLQGDKTLFSYFSIGLLNGYLPCGLVYVAIASSLALGNPAEGALLMFAFGLGTLPVMASLMVFGKFISQKARATINRMVPYIIGIMAILLILRGLNLGIPYLSPLYNAEEEKVEKCCGKQGE